jgi:hypothetical protein
MNANSRVRARANRTKNDTDLISALENVRTRFAVAVALEQKSTTRRLWRGYLETEDRLRRCLKALRILGQSACAGSRQCALAFEALIRRSDSGRHEPGNGEAQHLFWMLQEVLVHLEKIAPD